MQLSLLRADLLHPQVAGPKYIRLAAWLAMAKAQGYSKVVSAGGMHSNHLHALAHLAPAYGLEAEAYVRGLAYTPRNPLLMEAEAAGLALIPTTKAAYASMGLGNQMPQLNLGGGLFIPMGGDGQPGQTALDAWARQVWAQLPARTQLALTAGTGSTLQAFAASMPADAHLWLAAPFKDNGFLQGRIPLAKQAQVTLLAGANRFGKPGENALHLGQVFVQETGIPIDNLYMPTLLARLAEVLGAGKLPCSLPWAMLHCGGQSVNKLIPN